MAIQYCVVCGRGSNRTWNNVVVVGPNTYVACDFHDQVEINYAVANVAVPGPTVQIDNPGTDVSPQS